MPNKYKNKARKGTPDAQDRRRRGGGNYFIRAIRMPPYVVFRYLCIARYALLCLTLGYIISKFST